MSDDLGDRLRSHPRWRWCEGMRDRRGVRIVDLELWDGTEPPDLTDPATAGVMLGLLADMGLLSDVVRQDGAWIVAVDLPEDGLQGWIGDTMGEAAGWAMLAAWDALPAAGGTA
jgi:hypothetical protein